MKQKNDNGFLSEQDEQQLQTNVNALKQIAETGTTCDHGTIGDRWTYGILIDWFYVVINSTNVPFHVRKVFVTLNICFQA
jgi:hypothetical protein